MSNLTSYITKILLGVGLAVAVGSICPLQAQTLPKGYEVDTSWPKPFPGKWASARLGGICVDAKDHIFVVDRGDIQPKEKLVAEQEPPIIELDPDGKVVNSFGDRKIVPEGIHGCFVDKDNNVWVGGYLDSIVQKYTHDGSKLLLQIGTKGDFDSSTHLITGIAMNQSHTLLNKPSGIVTDAKTGDVFISDGYGNHRVAVFDKNGTFLRQWGHQASRAEAIAGEPGAIMGLVHGIAIDNQGLIYVCDRQGNRVQVFDQMGNFKRNIWVKTGYEKTPDPQGTAWWVAFSPDPGQKYMYVADGFTEQIHVLDHETGNELLKFGRPGHQAGEFTHAHTMAVDSKGYIYIAETDIGRRIQRFKPVM